MNTNKTLSPLVLILLLAGCGGGSTPDTVATTEDTATTTSVEPPKTDIKPENIVVTINGRVIDKKTFNNYVKQRNAGNKDKSSTSQARLLDEFINYELAIQDAERLKLDEKPEVKLELETHRKNTLASAAFQNYVVENPLTEEQMRKDYEARMSELTLTEYNLRHILLTNADDATTVMAALKDGGDFFALVKKFSTGPSASDGGLLGWQSEFDLLPEFRVPVEKLKKGQYATSPIKTRFGWHILYLDDKRINPPPKYEEVKDRVKQVLQRSQIEKYLLQLRSTAKVSVPDATATSAPSAAQRGINIDSYGNN